MNLLMTIYYLATKWWKILKYLAIQQHRFPPCTFPVYDLSYSVDDIFCILVSLDEIFITF